MASSGQEREGGHGDLAGKVVIVTGAGKGLGRAYALEMASRGACLVVNNRCHASDSVRSADAVVSEIVAAGGKAVADYSDAADPDCGAQLLAQALESFGRLDIVIANAGVSEATSFHKQPLSEFRRIVDINLMGTAHLLHPTFSHLYRQHSGAIVVSSSAAGLYGEHGLPAYSASKAGIIGLCHALALEGAPHGVRVNTIAPFASTAMTRESLPPALRERLSPADVAPVVAWLVSDSCPLNGETLVAGGGNIARARPLLSAPVAAGSTPAEVAAAWSSLSAPDRDSTSAVAMFMDFARSLPS
ncbi:SDR family NAD(P)-dependent oxidoreductase [Haliea sp. E1-2-M8]|uniref:SDR family NAD(P)-dependent oxidoreductase n=1 Tax=Haliea sp. E1-2-M8 TaxID=3064706 RepID=UPI00272668FD|nr:SDR family NAD(P)-dependent oxidoreductase [Haliea sp. E1-2-M8]MDO8861813.1 SDR family NAD(P)-dependent oxidoreductase [Haliea sp. E1-2-M8]